MLTTSFATIAAKIFLPASQTPTPGKSLAAAAQCGEWPQWGSGGLCHPYGQASIDALGDGVRSFHRWGFQQGEGALMGALRDREPITRPIALAIGGTIDALSAARQAQLEVQAVKAASG